MHWLKLLLILLLQQLGASVWAQSCCSGGVPVANNLGLTPQDVGSWQLNLSYDLNTLQTLKSGTQTLDDAARQRQTHSGLVQLGYNFHKRWSIETFVAYVRQERLITQFGQRDETSTSGIGDVVGLVKYKIRQGARGSN